MALATRCPHCETVFKLDPHLLAPHDGRVRCGHCQEVFDAAHHRFELPEETAESGVAQHAAIIDDEVAVGPSTHSGSGSATAPATEAEAPPKPKPFTPRNLDLGASAPAKRAETPPAPPPPSAPPVITRRADDADRTVYAEPPAFTNAPTQTRATPPADDPTQPAHSARPAPSDAANEPSAEPAEPPRVKQFVRVGSPQTRPDAPSSSPLEPSPFVNPVDDRAEPFIGPVDRPVDTPPPARPAPAPSPAPAAAPAWGDDPEPAFGGRPAGGHQESANEAFPVIREARPYAAAPAASGKSKSKSTGKRIAGIVFAVLLIMLLLVQLAWWQRETVMVNVPGSHALFVDICEQLGCTISPPRNIDGLQIESSGLRQVEGPHKLELKLSLRNRTDVALAYPALELTLLDDKNNVAIRRVLWPQDYARPGTIFAIGLPPQSAQPVVVRLDTGDAVAANYRVQVFYP